MPYQLMYQFMNRHVPSPAEVKAAEDALAWRQWWQACADGAVENLRRAKEDDALADRRAHRLEEVEAASIAAGDNAAQRAERHDGVMNHLGAARHG